MSRKVYVSDEFSEKNIPCRQNDEVSRRSPRKVSFTNESFQECSSDDETEQMYFEEFLETDVDETIQDELSYLTETEETNEAQLDFSTEEKLEEASKVSFCLSQRNTRQLCHEGYKFDRNRYYNNTIYWRCKSRIKHGCLATFKTQTLEENDGGFEIISRSGKQQTLKFICI
jgi:FLYWCH zinc finger domain